jgi:hypothetical protein
VRPRCEEKSVDWVPTLLIVGAALIAVSFLIALPVGRWLR